MIGSAGVVWNDTGLRNDEAKKKVQGPSVTYNNGSAEALAHLVSAESKSRSDKCVVR